MPKVPSHEELAEFLRDHPEPFVQVPPEAMSEFRAGKIAVLTLSSAGASSDEPIWEAIGFADHETRALRLLQERISGLTAVTKRPVNYFLPQIWPPIPCNAFIPLITAHNGGGNTTKA
jgi:hypothetical protein